METDDTIYANPSKDAIMNRGLIYSVMKDNSAKEADIFIVLVVVS